MINRFIKIFLAKIIGVCIIVFSVTNYTIVTAQQPNQWSPERQISGYLGDTLPPLMVADQNHTVHAFASQWVGADNDQLAIVYRRWSSESGWDMPVDVLLSPLEQARLYGVFLAQTRMIHVMFFGGSDRGADIYYSRAPAALAGQARSWLAPMMIGQSAVTPSAAALAGDDKGNLVVAYSGNIEGNGVYVTYSTDFGDTWSESLPIFLTYSDELWANDIRLNVGASGQLHAVWNVVNPMGHNISGHYARMDVTRKEWTEPIEFAEGIGVDAGMGIAHPLVIEHKNKVIIIYNNGIPPIGVPPAEWVVWSEDNGETWTQPLRAFPQHVGRSGQVSFVVDSNNDLHVIFGERIPLDLNGVYAENGGMWHSKLLPNDSWSAPVPIISTITMPGGPQVDPKIQSVGAYDAQAIVSQGNVLLATWRSDPGSVANGVWYSFTTLDAPELAVVPLPSVQPAATPVPPDELARLSALLSPVVTPTSLPHFVDPAADIPKNSIFRNPAAGIIIGVGPAILLILITLGLYRLYQSKQP